MAADLASVRNALLALQAAVCAGLEEEDGAGRFGEDAWERPEGGGGVTRILSGGAVFEKAGVGFSHVHGAQLPPSATARRPELAGRPWEAMGVSVVIHPKNPYVPTAHMNVRCVSVAASEVGATGHGQGDCGWTELGPNEGGPKGLGPPSLAGGELRRAKGASRGEGAFWFGGGFDLTPFYGFEEDAVHWHRTARAAVEPFGSALFSRFKRQCDDYFFLKHRAEPRGIGGLFFDDFDEGGFERAFALTRAVGAAFLPAYRPIVARRKGHPYGERERSFQLYRRGRYVEFNLVWDRGTHFGLQSGGRTESILMSLPPLVRWDYDWKPGPGTPEARLYEDFLRPRDWV